jgi:trans-aconitate methyltransferase
MDELKPDQLKPDQQVAQGKQWDASLYDSGHSFVWQYGLELIDLLEAREGERILDLGCGTGHLSARISASGAEVIGIDKSPAMIEQARQNYPGLRFEVADATDFRFDHIFDAVFSNAAIHWMRPPAAVVAQVWRALKVEGRFVAEFGGKANLSAIHTALNRAVLAATYPAKSEPVFKYYPSIGEYATLLESHGFLVSQASYFDRPTPLGGGDAGLENWIKMFADNFLSAVPDGMRGDVIRDVENDLRSEAYRDGTWFADYRRIRVLATRAAC